MGKRIVFATGNAHKMIEIRQILEDLGMPVISMKEVGVDPEIIEDGTTFEENALIKAREVANLLPNDIVLADDSGLEVDALNKEPGIYSARYAGENTSYEIKNQLILDRVKDVPEEKRTARFACAVAAVFPDGTEKVVRENMEGRIAYESAGANGFGYDPIFYLPEYKKSTAELSPEEKNALSHRGRALRQMEEELRKRIR